MTNSTNPIYTQYPIRNTQYNLGFTLVELLIGITILAVIAGVGGDMIISTIRSYNKTQVLNTVTQNGNYALGVWRDDMQNAKSVICNSDYSLTVTNRDGANILYLLTPTANVIPPAVCAIDSNGSLTRNGFALVNTGNVTTSTVHVLTGSEFDCPATGSTSNLYTLVLSLGQSCNAGVRIDNTALTVLRASVVVRGGYN